MPRPRTLRKDLPPRLYCEDGIYFFRPKSGKRITFGSDERVARAEYWKLVGRHTDKRSDSTPGAAVHASVRRATKGSNAAELQFMRSHDLWPAESSRGRRRGRASVWSPSAGASGAGHHGRG
jgi:hypothetical protein